MTRFLITEHAVDQYIARWAPGATLAEAHEQLTALASRASRLRTKTLLGQDQWQCDDPPIVLVTRRRRGDAHQAVVTVLPSQERLVGAEDETTTEVLDEFLSHAPAPAPVPMGVKPIRERTPPPNVVAAVKLVEAKRERPTVCVASAPRALGTQANHALVVAEMVAKRDAEKTARFVATNERNDRAQKQALRAAVHYLLRGARDGDAEAFAILEAIQAIEPGFVTEGFVLGKRKKEMGAS